MVGSIVERERMVQVVSAPALTAAKFAAQMLWRTEKLEHGNAGSAPSKKTSVPAGERRRSNLALKETVAERLPALHIENMSEHKVTLKWERGGTEFSYQRYPRDHSWSFDDPVQKNSI